MSVHSIKGSAKESGAEEVLSGREEKCGENEGENEAEAKEEEEEDDDDEEEEEEERERVFGKKRVSGAEVERWCVCVWCEYVKGVVQCACVDERGTEDVSKSGSSFTLPSNNDVNK